MISLNPVDELVCQACTVLAQQRHGAEATVKIFMEWPTYLARVVIQGKALEASPLAEEAAGSTPRHALDALLAMLQPGRAPNNT
jgi:hypothetical protein